MNSFKYISTLVIVLTSILCFGQNSNKYCIYDQVALEKYQDKDLDGARIYIDSAIIMCEDLRNDPYSHHIKGFVYYELYKRDEVNDPHSTLRDSAFNAFLQSNSLDVNNEFTTKNNKSLRNIATRIQMNVANLLDTNNYTKAIEVNNLYKETLERGNIKIDNQPYDISFYISLGGIFTDLYENNKTSNASMIDSAIVYYKKSLELDSLNFVGNLQLGYVYHNLSIDIILAMDPEDDIMTMYENQEKSSNFGLLSLPYLKIAHQQQPKNTKILYGLAGIYFMLQEKDKSDFYQNLYNELTKEQDGSQSPPRNDN
jgi:hypothetical protein